MTWNEAYSDSYLKVYVTGFQFMSAVWNFYRWEKSFIKIKFLDYVNQGQFWVNGELYEGYADNEEVIIEISNIIRAAESGELTVENTPDGSGAINVTLDFNSIAGIAETTENADDLMKEIPFISGFAPFWLQVQEKLEYLKTNGSWATFYGNQGVIASVNVNSMTDFANVIRRFDGPVPSGELINFIIPACTTDKIQLNWIGRFGVKKSWWFTVDKIIYSSDKEISLQVLDSGFNVQKNKKTSILISHKDADVITQKYISDIVLSDEVVNVDSGQKVRIENNNFEVLKRKNDINLIVNLSVYDTI